MSSSLTCICFIAFSGISLLLVRLGIRLAFIPPNLRAWVTFFVGFVSSSALVCGRFQYEIRICCSHWRRYRLFLLSCFVWTDLGPLASVVFVFFKENTAKKCIFVVELSLLKKIYTILPSSFLLSGQNSIAPIFALKCSVVNAKFFSYIFFHYQIYVKVYKVFLRCISVNDLRLYLFVWNDYNVYNITEYFVIAKGLFHFYQECYTSYVFLELCLEHDLTRF